MADSSKRAEETALNMPPPGSKSTKSKNDATYTSITKATDAPYVKPAGRGWRRGVSVFDFILRICALIAALAAATTMGTTDQTLPFFTQFFQFQAQYNDFPTFTLCSISFLSFCLSFVHRLCI